MTPSTTAQALETEREFLTKNYNPLPVVAASAKGAWVTDVEGKNILTVWRHIPRSILAMETEPFFVLQESNLAKSR